MTDGRTTQTNDTGGSRRELPSPGLVACFLDGAPASLVLPIADGGIVVGRSLLGQHGFDDSRMSRKHVHVSFGPGGWHFRDLESRNGSSVDGERFTGELSAQAPRVLRAGDTLLLPVADIEAFAARPVEVRGGVVLGPLLQRVFELVARTAQSSPTLHVYGETGVGKELAARHFHERGRHARGPFVAVNCAAVPAPVAERLLFGVRRGAYTGADADADGFVQAADGGTLFLDEVADLDASVQGKLLRTLESGEVMPLGAAKARSVDMALVSATAVDLQELVAKKAFREDLYFRVARPAVRVPPLRDRPEEIPWLLETAARDALPMHVSFVEAALCRVWPGNVRELLAEARAAVQAARDENAASVRASHFAPGAGEQFERDASSGPTAEDEERARQRERIVDALRRDRGNVAAAARRLGLHRTQLRRLISRHEIDPRRLV